MARMAAARKRRRRMSPAKRRMYRRRRIVVLIALFSALALAVAGIWGIGRGVVALDTWIRRDDINAVSRQDVPTPKKTSGVPSCSASDVQLQLSASAASVSVGGSVQFSATISYIGAGQCLIDAADDSRVLTITSGDRTVYRSDVCAVKSRMLLMSKSDEMKQDKQTLVWGTNSNASDTTCRKNSELPKVDRGTYVAKLSLKNAPNAVSDPVTVEVK